MRACWPYAFLTVVAHDAHAPRLGLRRAVLEHVRSRVVGCVVHGDELEVLVVLVQHARDCIRGVPLMVARRHEHADNRWAQGSSAAPVVCLLR